MNTKPLIAKLFFCMLGFFTSVGLHAQSEIVNFLKGGIADSETLMQAYLEPLGNSMGANLNGGWYNTAKLHNTLGFDITLSVTAAIPPESAKTFDLNSIGLKILEVKDPAHSIAPTFAGSRNKGPMLVLRNPESGNALLEFESISGLNVPIYPLPMIKGAIGLPKGVEIMGRFIPKFSFEDISLGLWGAGIKYNFLRHIPGVNNVPFLNASIMGAYTGVYSSAAVDFQKNIFREHVEDIPILGGRENYDNQEIAINLEGFTGMLLVSYDLPVISIYGGTGYSQAKTNVNLYGDYPMISDLKNESGEDVIQLEDATDPIALAFENYSGLQYTIGLKVKIAIISFHADYTRANYNLFSLGLGLTLR